MKYEMPFTKDYYEEYAKLVLNDILKLNLIHRQERYNEDRPDLISTDEKIGIEVTNAFDDKTGRQNKLFQQIYPRKNRNEIIKKEAERLGITENLHFRNRIAFLSENYNSIDKIKILAERINKKLENLNTAEFNKYKINSLFINAYDYFQEDIKSFFSKYNNYINNSKIKFDFIYVFNCDGLFIFNNEKIIIKKYDEKKLSSYKEKSLKYAQSFLNK